MSVQNLLLVMPPQQGLLRGFATGLISLANYVGQKLPEVQIDLLDLSSDRPEELAAKIRGNPICEEDNLAVGITTTTASYQSALNVARSFKNLKPSSVVILGGHHAGADAEIVLRSHPDLIDFVIVGEGERSLTSFLSGYPECSSVPGLAYLKENSYIENPPPALLEEKDLDLIPTTFRGNGLSSNPGKFDHVTYVSARGCPLKCAFCSVANQRIRAKSVSQVVKDIEYLARSGFSRIAIEDNFFAHSPSRTKQLCVALSELRRNGVHFTWDCQTRVESMAHDWIIPVMTEAGCEAIYLGVESLNEDQLLYLGKASQPQRYLDSLLNVVVPRLLKSPIDCYINLQLGILNENDRHDLHTVEVLRRLGKLAVEAKKIITIFPQLHVVYPGTPHFRMGLDQKRFPKNVFESFTDWEARHSPVLKWLGEHFAHGTGGLPEGILVADRLRRGDYEVNADEVFRISAMLKRIARIAGIKVFDYGSYLVGDFASDGESTLILQ
jgi:radical SAM superfamily enzyme YgiQ (UPF0313 family)